MQRVIFDSSFLLAVAESPTTWFEDIVEGMGRFEPVILECAEAELKLLSSGKGRKARLARVALALAAGFSRAPCGEAPVDDEIVSAALSTGAAVATVDGELIRQLKAAHVKVVSLKKGRASV